VRYIRSERNLGAGGRNLGMKAARGSVVMTLDDDVHDLDDRAAARILERFQKNARLGAVTFTVVHHRTKRVCNWVHHCRVEDYHDREFPTYELAEGATAFRRSAVEVAGYYPEDFFLSHEGPALAFRLMDAGYEVIYAPVATVSHHVASEGRTSWRNYYYDTRNSIWLAAISFPLGYATRYLTRTILAMLVYALRDGHLLAWAKAILDGLLGLRMAFRERRVLTRDTMNRIREIDQMRPPLSYMIRKRLFRRNVALSMD
jgi:GT2 family glycosyltransferase